MSVQKLLNRGLCGLVFGGMFTALCAVPARADECGVNMFNPKLLLQADFTDAGNNQYKGKWNGHLDRYVEKYPFGFVSGERYKITYKLDCGDPKVANQYLTFVKSDNTTVKINRQACLNGNGTVEIISPEGAKIVGLKVETFSANELESGEPYNGEILISNLMVTKADVDTSRFISYNPCTRVATQTMLENSSYGMRDRLNYVANVITDLITQSKTNTRNIDTLSQDKQTRPAEGCAEGYDTCLLVKDTDGKNVWYPIETCGVIGPVANVGEFLSDHGGDNVNGNVGKACDGRYPGIGPSTDNACQLNEWVNVHRNAAVYGIARAVSIAESTQGTIVQLPNDVQTGVICVCKATAYAPVETLGSTDFQSTFGPRTAITTDNWVVEGLVLPNSNTGEMPSDYDAYCISACGFGHNKSNYFANITNACLDSAVSATAVDPNVFEPKFTVTTTQMGTSDTFNFYMSAQGVFHVDCGEGGTLAGTGVSGNIINRASDTTPANYTCTYTTPGTKTVGFGGTATAYNANENSITAALAFTNNAYVSSISGSLGELFPTLGSNNGQQPTFINTFNNCPHLTAVPAGLFNGITGNAPGMFDCTFCGTGLTQIPATLFSGISGAADWMFQQTFDNTSIEAIPSGLFSHISGSGAGMFKGTFESCRNITSIPEDLFSGVNAPAQSMFHDTFLNTGITSIPGTLFSNIHGSADLMFAGTFSMTNISSIPSNLFSTITGGAYLLFDSTFYDCDHLTAIPENLFSGINQAADHMFYRTFALSDNLSGYIPASAFSGLINAGSPYSSNMWDSAFTSTALATSCPTGTTQVTTGYEQYWSNRVACQ